MKKYMNTSNQDIKIPGHWIIKSKEIFYFDWVLADERFFEVMIDFIEKELEKDKKLEEKTKKKQNVIKHNKLKRNK